MSVRIVVVALAIAALGPVAWAQEPQSSPEPNAREVSAARARADRIIANGAEAKAYFENITDSGTATVRHTPSGMTCAFYGETPYDFIRLFPSQPGGPRVGDDAMCNMRTAEMDLSTYATRYRTPLSADFVLADARRAIEQRFPDARLYEEPLASASIGDAPAPMIAAYRVTVQGSPKLTFALVSHRGDWSFKARATGETKALDATGLNLLISLTFLQALPPAGP